MTAALHHVQVAKEKSAQMHSMIDEMLHAHFAQTSQDTQSKLDAVASNSARQLILATESTQRDLVEKRTAKMEHLRTELAQACNDSLKATQHAQDVHAHVAGATQFDVGMLKAQVELETANRTASEQKTASVLDLLLQKIQKSEIKSGELQREMQQQRQEAKDMGEKINVVLTEMQTISLQFDLLSGVGTDFNVGNLEGANWNLQDESMDQKPAPQTVPMQDENKLISLAGTTLGKDASAQVPTPGTIVPPHNPRFSGIFVSTIFPPIQEKKKSPVGFEFSPVFAPTSVHNSHPSGSLLHNNRTQSFIAP